MTQSKSIAVVAGLLFKDGRVLACQRRADGPFPLKWEFPGGKIEPDEEAAAALVRELREELGIDSERVKEILTFTHSYPGSSTVKLTFFQVSHYSGEVINHVFKQIRWLSPVELGEFDFLEGDRPVLEWLMSASAATLWHHMEL